MAEDRLLTSEETAAYLNTSPRLLNDWRYREQGPPWLKLGRRTVRYSKQALDEWLAACKVEVG